MAGGVRFVAFSPWINIPRRQDAGSKRLQMHMLNKLKPPAAQVVNSPRVLSRLAVDRKQFLIHELDSTPGQGLKIRVGLTRQRAGKLKPLNHRQSVCFDATQLPAYAETVARLLAQVKAAARADLLPLMNPCGPSFAEKMASAAFDAARRAGQ